MPDVNRCMLCVFTPAQSSGDGVAMTVDVFDT
jgi:hypothetical protein